MLNVSEVLDKTQLTSKDIDNLVHWGHVAPVKVGHRRMYDRTAYCQMRLYSMAKGLMPPSITCAIGALIPKFLDKNPNAEMIAVWLEDGKWTLGESVPIELIGMQFKAAAFTETSP